MVETWYTHGQWVDVIECTIIRRLMHICSFIFSYFLSLQFLFLLTPFSGTVRPRRLKRYTHLDSGWMNRVNPKFS